MPTPSRKPHTDRHFGRDGISGLVDADRALRARDVSRPSAAHFAAAEAAAEEALARLDRSQR